MGFYDSLGTSGISPASIAGGVLQTGMDVWRMGRQSDEASFARDWSAQQYAKRYQVTVQDLMAAGLNPLLAADGGSVSGQPSGSPAEVGDVSNPVTTAAELRLKSAARDAAVAQAMSAKAAANKADAERVGQSLTNKQIEESVPALIRKAKAEATSAEGLAKVDKATGDFYEQFGAAGKGVKEFLPFFIQLLRGAR